MTSIGERLMYLRKKRGWSQFEAGTRLGVTKSKSAAESKIKRMELDQQEPSASEVVALAEMYEVGPGWLLTGREQESAGEDVSLPPDARGYLKTIMDVVYGDNFIAKQILASARFSVLRPFKNRKLLKIFLSVVLPGRMCAPILLS